MTTPMTAASLGTLPYDDVYLDQISSEDDDDDEEEIDENNVNIPLKPLMSPRKRPKVAMRMPRGPTVWQVRQQRRCLKAFYVIMMLSVISLVTFVLFRITHDYNASLDANKQPEYHVTVFPNGTTIKVPEEIEVEVLPCTSFDIEDVWIQNFPMYQTETAVRMIDVNRDGTLDVILGYSTAANGYFSDENLLCNIYFDGEKPCFGGIMALDGRTGELLWNYHTKQEIFALNCNVDIDQDGVKDCLGAGRTGLFMLLSGATGEAIWVFDDNDILESVSNLYTAQFVQDMDGDGIQDVLNIHGGDPFRVAGSPVKHIGKLVLFSGRDGHVLSFVEVPDKIESYYSPQVYYKKDGKPWVIFGSGGETHIGSLWIMPLHDVMDKTTIRAKKLYTGEFKGVMTPPVLVDLTGDGVEDIVMRMYDAITIALDGESYVQMWNYSTPQSESYSTPAPGYYNDDDVLDFMIQANIGPGYPIYYSSEVTIIDGRNGKPLFEAPMLSSGAVQTSPLTISTEGRGNDAFLYFLLYCLGHEEDDTRFVMPKTDGAGGLSRTDFCFKRFGTKETYTKMYALNQHMKTPGQGVYNSLNRKSVEYQYKVNSTLLAKAYLEEHPQVSNIMEQVVLQHMMGNDKGLDDIVGDIVSSKHDVTTPPPYTQQLYRPNHHLPNVDNIDIDTDPLLPLINDEDEESDEEEEDGKYSTLLEKLQNFFTDLGLNKEEEEEEEQQQEEEEDPILDGFQGYSDVYRHSKPQYEPQQDYPSRYTSTNNRYRPSQDDSRYRPALDRNDYNDDNDDDDETQATLSKLLQKYPWLIEELYNNQDQESQADYKHPSKKDEAELWLPRRQWGRVGDLWNRERRDASGPKVKGQDAHGAKKKLRGRHMHRTHNVREKDEYKRRSKVHNLPHPNRNSYSHSTNKKPLKRTDHHAYSREHVSRANLNSKLNKHLPSSKARRPIHRTRRPRRHAGSHDAGGVMRLLSTGSLAPPIDDVDSSESIDVIFPVYWFYPVDHEIILPEEEDCLDLWAANETERMRPGNPFFGLDHDAYEDESRRYCIKKNHQSAEKRVNLLKSMDPLDVYPFNIHAGEMTVYRLRLTCQCGLEKSALNKRCAKILPYKEQQWGAYMGTYGNSHWQQRKSP